MIKNRHKNINIPTAQKKYSLDEAYSYCKGMIKKKWMHKWQLVSLFLFPKEERKRYYAIFAFLCLIDDVPEHENKKSVEETVKQINAIAVQIHQCYLSNVEIQDPLFIALKDIIEKFSIPEFIFRKFCDGCIMDATTNRYETFVEFLDYCDKVSNTLGRIALHALYYQNETIATYMDRIMTSVQIIDSIIDIDEDYLKNNRLYFPKEYLDRFHCDEATIFKHPLRDEEKQMLHHMANQMEKFLNQANPIFGFLRKKDQFSFKLVYFTCYQLLNKVRKINYDVLSKPVKLNWIDKFNIIVNSLIKNPLSKNSKQQV